MLRTLLGLLVAANIGLAANDANADVLVIGAGIAGLTTALEAARGGATVTVVDLSSVFGGHAVVSEGGLSLVGTPLQERLGVQDSPDIASQDILRWGDDANAVWVRIYVERSRRDVFDWMTALGSRLMPCACTPGTR